MSANAPASDLLSRTAKYILVTGGAGFIGSHLVERLLAEGKPVVIIDDFSTGSCENLRPVANHPSLRIIDSKLSACPELSELVAKAECIFHLAAAVGVELVLQSPVRTLQVNLRETEVILEAASRHGVPVLLASSSEVYGKGRGKELSEQDDLIIGPPQITRWGYACSKLMDEFLALAYAREHRLPVVIARIFNTVGPRQAGRYGMVLPRFITAAKTGRPLRVHGNGRQTRCFCYVGDTVEALLRLTQCEAARGQIFNVGGTEEVAIAALAQRVIDLTKSPSKIEFVSYDEAYGPGFEDLPQRKPNVQKLEATTGFRPNRSLDSIIALAAQA